MSAPPRIPRASPTHRRKPNIRTNRSHEDFVRLLPCLACGRAPPSECAHVRSGTDGGAGLKPNSRFTLPLCARCHRTGPRAQHIIGEPAFYAALRIDALDVAARLYTISGDYDQGLRAISRARAAMGLRGG